MRITHQDLKNNEGEISLTPDSLDDLWHLNYVIEPRDFVIALTKRTVEGQTDKLRPEKTEKKPVRIGIGVETVEFHKFSNRLRIHGVIKYGPDVGSYHTLNIEEGTNLSIKKRWRRDQLERIEHAVELTDKPIVVILTIEEGEAAIGRVRQFGVVETHNIKQSLGKGEGNYRDQFFTECANQLTWAAAEAEAIVIAGPGFTKDDFLKYLKNSHNDLAKICVTEDTAHIGMSGFQEVLRRGAIDRIVKDSRIGRETALMEELLAEIAKDGTAAYGIKDVKKATEFGAVGTLLILDEVLREGGHGIRSLVTAIEHLQAEIVVFSSEFEPGTKLHALGDVAALLRYRIE